MSETPREWLQEDEEEGQRNLSFYRFDAPYHDEGRAASDPGEALPEAEPLDTHAGEAEDDEEDLFAALDAALDQLEHEEQLERFRPRDDSLEITPGFEQVYRRYLAEFICTDVLREAPTDFEATGHVPRALQAQLQTQRLLADYRRERSRVDHWQDILPKKKRSRAA